MGGNPDIAPEKSWSYENGLVHKWNVKNKQLQSELTYFFMKVDDWIMWQPTNLGYWSPVNVMQVTPKGIEFSSHLTLNNTFIRSKVGLAYSYTASTVSKSYLPTIQETGKQLMYIPLHNSMAHGTLFVKNYMAGANLTYTGYRYTNNSNTDWLDPYLLLNLLAGKSFYWNHTSVQVSGRVNNLLNKSYQNMENRPMPCRNFQVSLQVNFAKATN
jgi:iron complex outermembrane receptor protein